MEAQRTFQSQITEDNGWHPFAGEHNDMPNTGACIERVKICIHVAQRTEGLPRARYSQKVACGHICHDDVDT